MKVDALKKQVDALKPLPKDVEGKIMQKFRLDWNYHSNAIEGNSLTFGETLVFLREGLTAKGKPLKDHLDMKGHNEAIEYLFGLIKNKEYELSERDIRELHKMLLVEPYESSAQTPDGQKTTKLIQLGEYKTQPNHVKTPTGDIHYYATPEETPARMTDLINWYRKEDSNLHPVVLAALLHYEFVNIHPFDDGNGRMSRLLMNLILIKNGFPPVVIKQANRNEYYAALAQADAKNYNPFIELIVNNLIHSLDIYTIGAKGEDITEPDDIDKEIEILKLQLSKEEFEAKIKSREQMHRLLSDFFFPLVISLQQKLRQLDELFLDRIDAIYFSTKGSNGNKTLSTEKIKDSHINFLNGNNSIENITEIQYGYNLKGFKKDVSNNFEVHNYITVAFSDFNFTVRYRGFDSKDQIIGPYNYSLDYSKLKSANIVSDFTKHFIQEIKRRSEN
ncbi:MAG: Fic family protein [Sphingobacteriales bacterium JAD_PAG50586_3]|nr:MAG: Fic family protein [Sphingobacteriales bacterium JAD_PAG50586_3]